MLRLEIDIKAKELECAGTQREIAGLALQFKRELQQASQSLDGRPEFEGIMQRSRETRQQSPLPDCASSDAHICRLHEELAALAAQLAELQETQAGEPRML